MLKKPRLELAPWLRSETRDRPQPLTPQPARYGPRLWTKLLAHAPKEAGMQRRVPLASEDQVLRSRQPEQEHRLRLSPPQQESQSGRLSAYSSSPVASYMDVLEDAPLPQNTFVLES